MGGKRGRPAGSSVRQNLVEILYFAGSAYGYELYKHYCELFPKVTLRVIYYHLRKGALFGEFRVEEIRKEEGEYSWGKSVEKTYYTLGPNAKPHAEKRIASYFEKIERIK